MTTFVRHYLLALQFFTRIPITGRLADWVGFSPAMLRATAAHFPGVGVLVGAMAAGLFLLILSVLPALPAAPWVAAVVSTVFTVLLTGAFHEDGLADLADGLGGSLERQRALEIMKDSRIGSFGAMAIGLALAAKLGLLTLLAQMQPSAAATALFAAHVTSRLMPLAIIRTLPHVGDSEHSKSKPLADEIGGTGLLIGLAWWGAAMAVVVWQLPDVPWVAGLTGSIAALFWMWRLLRVRLQGFTGDALGATQQVCEIAFYAALVVAWHPGAQG